MILSHFLDPTIRKTRDTRQTPMVRMWERAVSSRPRRELAGRCLIRVCQMTCWIQMRLARLNFSCNKPLDVRLPRLQNGTPHSKWFADSREQCPIIPSSTPFEVFPKGGGSENRGSAKLPAGSSPHQLGLQGGPHWSCRYPPGLWGG